jgi:hypothetical protein
VCVCVCVCACTGLVFVDMPEDGSLPSHVVYKIRQNASLTDSTLFVRERYWSPGPRTWNTPLYYQYGFVLIQVVNSDCDSAKWHLVNCSLINVKSVMRIYRRGHLICLLICIQDAIERAIIDLQVNRSVKHPGLYIHQMPSPCFMHDE